MLDFVPSSLRHALSGNQLPTWCRRRRFAEEIGHIGAVK